jgi:hypothetical protein
MAGVSGGRARDPSDPLLDDRPTYRSLLRVAASSGLQDHSKQCKSSPFSLAKGQKEQMLSMMVWISRPNQLFLSAI